MVTRRTTARWLQRYRSSGQLGLPLPLTRPTPSRSAGQEVPDRERNRHSDAQEKRLTPEPEATDARASAIHQRLNLVGRQGGISCHPRECASCLSEEVEQGLCWV